VPIKTPGMKKVALIWYLASSATDTDHAELTRARSGSAKSAVGDHAAHGVEIEGRAGGVARHDAHLMFSLKAA
jgi:hypothetical protein